MRENAASYKIMEKLGMSRTDVYGGRQNKRAGRRSYAAERKHGNHQEKL